MPAAGPARLCELAILVRERARERCPHAHRFDREVVASPVVANHRLVADALDQGAPHPRIERGDESQPEAAQARRQRRNRDHHAAQPSLSRVFPHQLAIGDALGSTDLVDAALVRREVERELEVREQVADRDRLRTDVHPPRRHHHRKSLDQRTEHLEGEAARSDHHGGPELDHGHA